MRKLFEREVTEIDIDIAELKDKIRKLTDNGETVDQNHPLKIKLKKLQDEKQQTSGDEKLKKEREKLEKERDNNKEKNMNEIIKKINKFLKEESKGAEYDAFFKKMLKKYGVESPDELSTDEKKKFFKEVEDGWTKEDPKTNDGDKNEEE